jgi:hypothetical protein
MGTSSVTMTALSSTSTASSAVSTASTSSTSSSLSSSSGGEELPAYVFGHSSTKVYRLDAEALTAVELGTFTFLDADGQSIPGATMTDFAVDSHGGMVGCGTHALYRIDSTTWVARKVAALEESYTGLTFVPVGFLDPDLEVLVGATASDGALYRIDQTTGVTELIGTYGSGWLTSGDIVAIMGDGMYATVKRDGETSDYLAKIEPTTGAATVLPQPTNATRIYGLGYWDGVLYGFNSDGDVLAIDQQTGAGQVAAHLDVSFWGAGVTTLAKTGSQ